MEAIHIKEQSNNTHERATKQRNIHTEGTTHGVDTIQRGHYTEGTTHGGDTIQRGYTSGWDIYMERLTHGGNI